MNCIRSLVAIALLVGGVSTAQATDYNLNTLSQGNNDFGPNSVVAGSFLDKINFSLSQDSSGDFGAGSLNFTLRGIPYLDIQGMSMSLFDSNDTQLGDGLDFSVNSLSSGDYYLQVRGNATGVAGGTYGGSIAVTSLPVPEPGMGSSLIAGLLMLSFMTLRRRNM